MKSTTKKLQRLSAATGLVIGTLLVASSSAQAASFTTNVSQNTDPTKDIQLNSIDQVNNKGEKVNIKNFSFVESVDMTSKITELNGKTTQLSNQARVAGKSNSGAASTDKGDNASLPMVTNEDPTGAQAAAFLGNRNLNNIIDTEDSGSFAMNLFFDQEIKKDSTGLDHVYLWERGENSNLIVQAIDSAGKVIGKTLGLIGKDSTSDRTDGVIANLLGRKYDPVKATDTPEQKIKKEAQIEKNRKDATDLGLIKNNQVSAGYSINTMEISESQKVGSWGLSLEELGVSSLFGIRVSAIGYSSNGPDLKVIARGAQDFNSTPVPEPGTILALGVVGGLGFLQRRRKQTSLLK